MNDHPAGILDKHENLLAEYRLALKPPPHLSPCPFPLDGGLHLSRGKVNFDAAMDREGVFCGIGVVVRDWREGFYAGMSKRLYGGFRVLAGFIALQFALDAGFHDLEVECDNILVITALKAWRCHCCRF